MNAMPAPSSQSFSKTSETAISPARGRGSLARICRRASILVVVLTFSAVTAIAGVGGASAAPDVGAVYAVNFYENKIDVIPTSGGSPTSIPLTPAPANVTGLVVSGGTIYMAQNLAPAPSAIVSVPVIGGTPSVLVEGLISPQGLEVSGDKLYFIDGGPGSGVKSVPLTGGTPTTVAPLPGGGFGSYDLAISNGRIYLPTTYGIYDVPLSGGTFQAVVPDVETAGLDVAGGMIYYTADFAVMKVPVAGGTPTPVVENLEFPNTIKASTQNLYYRENSEIWTVPVGGGTPAVFHSPEIGSFLTFFLDSGPEPEPEPETCWGSICP